MPVVTSEDGTKIAYLEVGAGPGLVLVHGAMQLGSSFARLAALLALSFRVVTYDRRGRGASGPAGDRYGLAREGEDLSALFAATGARFLFGLSSGAIIAMHASVHVGAVEKIALYEPPVAIGDVNPGSWSNAFLAALDDGDHGAAMALILKETGDRGLMTALPRGLLAALFRVALRKSALRDLLEAVREDIIVQRTGSMTLAPFSHLHQPALLLGGSLSHRKLTSVLDALAREMPNARRVELPGLGHIAADNRGAPDLIANALKAFF